jgi:DNA-binding transcriptional ArsR family regulator
VVAPRGAGAPALSSTLSAGGATLCFGGSHNVEHAVDEGRGVRLVRHPAPDEIEVTAVLHALSDPVRLEIVETLARCDECACGALGTSVSKSTLSHHLKVLREAGVTHTRLNGTQRFVSLRRQDLEERLPGLLRSVLKAHRTD